MLVVTIRARSCCRGNLDLPLRPSPRGAWRGSRDRHRAAACQSSDINRIGCQVGEPRNTCGVRHVEGLRRRVRRGQRIGADPLGRGSSTRSICFFHSPGRRHRLAEIVVMTTGRPVASERRAIRPSLHFGVAAAARLDDAGPHLAQHVRLAHKIFLLVGPTVAGMRAGPCGVRSGPCCRDTERPECAALHARRAQQPAISLSSRIVGGAGLARVAHHVVAHPRWWTDPACRH